MVYLWWTVGPEVEIVLSAAPEHAGGEYDIKSEILDKHQRVLQPKHDVDSCRRQYFAAEYVCNTIITQYVLVSLNKNYWPVIASGSL